MRLNLIGDGKRAYKDGLQLNIYRALSSMESELRSGTGTMGAVILQGTPVALAEPQVSVGQAFIEAEEEEEAIVWEEEYRHVEWETIDDAIDKLDVIDEVAPEDTDSSAEDTLEQLVHETEPVHLPLTFIKVDTS